MPNLAPGLGLLVNNRLLQNLKLNPNADIKLLKIGNEKQPLFVVDDLFLNPKLIVEYARYGEGFSRHKTDYYPGVRKPLPTEYGDLVCQFVSTILPARLAFPTSIKVTNGLSVLSIATQEPATLLPIQRIPHVDTSDSQQWAVVHYLCQAECGGTGFFRHLSSGFEVISEARNKSYQRMLEDDASTKGLPPGQYLDGSSVLFEQTHAVEAKYNRALIYPGNLLHSGLVKRWQITSIEDARLTANTFIGVAP